MMKKSNEYGVPFWFRLGCHSKQLGNQGHLAFHISFAHPLYLSFADHVHHLEALECSPRGLEREKTHPRLRQAFDEAVILFDQVVEVLNLSQLHLLRQKSSGFELSNRFGIGGVLIRVDHTWGWFLNKGR